MKYCLYATMFTLAFFAEPAAAQTNARAADKKPMALRAPFDTIASQHIVIQVKINGKGPYRMIFDTGAPFTLVNNKTAKDAGIFPKDFKKPFFALFGQMGTFKIDEVELGDVKVKGLQTQVMDHPTVAAVASIVGPLEGIVGFNFFAKYRMTIDYQAKEMTFVPVDFVPQENLMADLKKSLEKLADPKRPPRVLAPAGQWGFRAAKNKNDAEAGVNIAEVRAGTPAEKGGLKAGDRLLTLDGRWTDSVADCHAAAVSVKPGTAATLHIRRDGKEMDLTVKVAAGL
jgi:hypothetical protein